MKRRWKGWVISMLCAMHVAPALACPDDAVLSRIAGFKNLFIGEVHGTVETPEFVKCVIERKLELQGAGIIVSLELPKSVEGSAEFWNRGERFQDGRSSEAMHALYLYLRSKEEQGIVDLRFLDVGVGSPDRGLVAEPNALSENPGIVIYRGNAHTKESVYEGATTLLGEPAREFVHISVIAGDGGEFWGCSPDCGVHSFPAASAVSGEPVPHGSLIDGTDQDHDYVYFLESRVFTASLPWKGEVDCKGCVGGVPLIPRF